MERRGDRTERFLGMRRTNRRNLKMQIEFYDEETDVAEWAEHQEIFTPKPVAPPPPAPAAAADGVPVGPVPQPAAEGAAVPPPALVAPEVHPPAGPA